jgi:hypothetical protein
VRWRLNEDLRAEVPRYATRVRFNFRIKLRSFIYHESSIEYEEFCGPIARKSCVSRYVLDIQNHPKWRRRDVRSASFQEYMHNYRKQNRIALSWMPLSCSSWSPLIPHINPRRTADIHPSWPQSTAALQAAMYVSTFLSRPPTIRAVSFETANDRYLLYQAFRGPSRIWILLQLFPGHFRFQQFEAYQWPWGILPLHGLADGYV